MVSLAIISIAVLQYAIPALLPHWHYVLQRLYYVPIVLSGLFFGWKGGTIAASGSGVLYFLTLQLPNTPHYDLLDDILEVVVFYIVGTVTGTLAEREHRQRLALESTSEQLRRTFQELQDHLEQLKRADRLSALGQLSAGLAHEIRNPLASIEGAARLLQNDPSAEHHREEFLGIIQKECRRLDSLLTNFLNFARPRRPAISPVQVESLFESVIHLAKHGTAANRIAFESDTAPDLPQVECDGEQIKQVLLNLVINAMQAMPEGGVVTLRARPKGEYVSVQVQDRGQGISATNREAIFDPFFTTRDSGTGLGLSVAYQIVEQHRGTLSVEETGQAGTTFSLLLPFRTRQT